MEVVILTQFGVEMFFKTNNYRCFYTWHELCNMLSVKSDVNANSSLLNIKSVLRCRKHVRQPVYYYIYK